MALFESVLLKGSIKMRGYLLLNILKLGVIDSCNQKIKENVILVKLLISPIVLNQVLANAQNCF